MGLAVRAVRILLVLALAAIPALSAPRSGVQTASPVASGAVEKFGVSLNMAERRSGAPNDVHVGPGDSKTREVPAPLVRQGQPSLRVGAPLTVGPRNRHVDPKPLASIVEARPVTSPAAPAAIVSGLASWMPEFYGPAYLALPQGAGRRVRLCGAGGCLVMVSNDSGPSLAMQRLGRIADVAVLAWERICGVPRSIGLCRITEEDL